MIVVLLITLAVVVGIVVLFATMPPTGCTGDCNQGRNCTCQDTKWSKWESSVGAVPTPTSL